MIPCTACRYCIEGCPQHLQIRDLLKDVTEEFEKEEKRKNRSYHGTEYRESPQKTCTI